MSNPHNPVMDRMIPRRFSIAGCLLVLLLFASPVSAQKRPLTFTDIMKFRQVESPAISEDGNWVAYGAQPDRGDGEARIHSLQSKVVYSIPRGTRPVFSANARWVAVSVKPTAVELEKKEKDKDKPKSGMALLDTRSGDTVQVPDVQSFAFSGDSRWLAYLKYQEGQKSDAGNVPAAGKDSSARAKRKTKESIGADFVLEELQSGKTTRMAFVMSYAFDSTSHFLAYVVADTIGSTNGVYVCDLSGDGPRQQSLLVRENGTFTHITWSNANGRLAFVGATLDDKDKPGPGSLWLWDPGTRGPSEVVTSDAAPPGWILPSKNDLAWSKDGRSLFFGFRPLNDSDRKPEAKNDSAIDVFDIGALLKKREVDVWGWNDPRIIPNQKKMWKDVKDQTYRAVYLAETKRVIPLADLDVPIVEVPQNSPVALGRSNVPYLKALTWEGEFNDIYLVNVNDGARTKIASHVNGPVVLSPTGRFVLYYHDKHWFLYSRENSSTRNLTRNISVAFYDEEDDTPDPPTAYGFGGWVEGDRGLLLYDRYDIWSVATETDEAFNLTGGVGRKNQLTFRIEKLDPEARFYKIGERLLLTAYHNQKKFTALYGAAVGKGGVEKLVEEPARFTFLAKAKHAQRIIYTRESYVEFPDIWASDPGLRSSQKITDLNPQISNFAWGSAELIEWNSLDGTPLQGVLIKPGNYDPEKRYPVLVYFYELSSQRLYEFNQVVVNHRPCFPFYASNGYAVFLPDVRFDV